MDIRKLQRAIVDGLEDVKAQDILVFNTEHLSPLFERVIIATGTSNRQTKALASGVRESVKAAGLPVLATEGADNGEWIIVDCGAAVAHIMQPAIRDYYRLEEIWGGKPVKMKLGGGAKGLVKASEPIDEDEHAMAPERKAAARRSAAKAAPPRKPAAKKAVPRKKAAPTGPVTQTVVVKPVARKTAAAKAAGRKMAPAARKSAAGTTAARKTAGRKTAARKSAAGKTAARKAAPRRG
ncbi:MAG: ribosome silencing factor [Burkholderiaceae bacterium]|nr:ribosome silencing factor [Burkholderiaceae bacterium]